MYLLRKQMKFEKGEKGETYTIYFRFLLRMMYVKSISNGAEDVSYSAVGSSSPPNLVVDYFIQGRNDQNTATIATFEKLVDGVWVEVDKSYYTANNEISFSSVADSGTYRLKQLCYTATDNDGNVLYYMYAYDPDGTDKTYTVKINPAELTIDGVQAVSRPGGRGRCPLSASVRRFGTPRAVRLRGCAGRGFAGGQDG